MRNETFTEFVSDVVRN